MSSRTTFMDTTSSLFGPLQPTSWQTRYDRSQWTARDSGMRLRRADALASSQADSREAAEAAGARDAFIARRVADRPVEGPAACRRVLCQQGVESGRSRGIDRMEAGPNPFEAQIRSILQVLHDVSLRTT